MFKASFIWTTFDNRENLITNIKFVGYISFLLMKSHF